MADTREVQVTIEIRGCAGSGKSTLAVLVRRCLETAGFGVTVADSNGTGIADAREAATVEWTLLQRVGAITATTQIRIVTVQASMAEEVKCG